MAAPTSRMISEEAAMFRSRFWLGSLMTGTLAGFCFGQADSPHSAFEVASVKRLETPRARTAFPPDDPSRLIYPSVTFPFTGY